MRQLLQQATAAATASSTLLQRQCACGNRSLGGDCSECKRQRLQRKALSIGALDDPLEIEADRTADAVMASAVAAHAGTVPTRLSRAPLPATPPGDKAPGIVDRVLASSGRALDAATRAFMEPRFGRDFSQVRVHDDAQAQESARAVDAAAYTVGSHLVFGAGQLQPHTAAGQRLLAHELSHVLQQSGAAPAAQSATLRRAPAKGSGKSAPPYIKEIVVDQNEKQGITAKLSDGTSFTGECSTGKGHCCFDDSAGTAEGGACSSARSTQVGNNCTPIGTFTVTKKIGSGPIPFWTQFHDAKSVALHNYDYGTERVNGTPLSHGCVRLHMETAEKVFNGSVVGVTKVTVQGQARPKCSNSQLQAEWRGDFATAGSKPDDGEALQKAAGRKLRKEEIKAKQDEQRRNIREERTALKSALGVDDQGLDTQIADVAGGKPVVDRIPRCLPAKTQEEAKLPSATSAGFLDPAAAKTATDFSKALKITYNAAVAEKVVKKFGEKLWQDATAAARAGSDDRQLYWSRLMLSSALREWNPFWAADADALRRLHARLLQLLEQTSRGMSTAVFGKDPDQKRILISGFDPFGFTSGGDIHQSNLSGAAALALDGQTLTDGKNSAQVQSVVYPVRYADFNEGVVENFLRPHLSGPNPPHLVMSISQGGAQFELEEFAGRRRSTTGFKDNLGQDSGGSPKKPIEPPGVGPGKEFIRASVPDATLKNMRGALGRNTAIKEETQVKDLPAGTDQPRTSDAGPPKDAGLSVEGSGGGFLSNEIFYRNSLLISSSGAKVPTIHLHTPQLQPGETDSVRNKLIATIRKVLEAALPGI
jgi:pyrrolidone-carboxylate peptidase